jgi:hypothetical protein
MVSNHAKPAIPATVTSALVNYRDALAFSSSSSNALSPVPLDTKKALTLTDWFNAVTSGKTAALRSTSAVGQNTLGVYELHNAVALVSMFNVHQIES